LHYGLCTGLTGFTGLTEYWNTGLLDYWIIGLHQQVDAYYAGCLRLTGLDDLVEGGEGGEGQRRSRFMTKARRRLVTSSAPTKGTPNMPNKK